jgi:rhodanese-related sulfurtransferase
MSPQKSSRRTTQHHISQNRGPSAFLRKPATQIGILLIAAIIIAFIVLTGQPAAGPAAEISVDEAYQLYQNNGAYFLDVREQSEWDEYHAPKTTLIPLGQLETRLAEVPRDRTVVVVCRSGNRSQQGRDMLKQAGFTQVTSMAGGLKTWRDKGYPIEP